MSLWSDIKDIFRDNVPWSFGGEAIKPTFYAPPVVTEQRVSSEYVVRCTYHDDGRVDVSYDLERFDWQSDIRRRWVAYRTHRDRTPHN